MLGPRSEHLKRKSADIRRQYLQQRPGLIQRREVSVSTKPDDGITVLQWNVLAMGLSVAGQGCFDVEEGALDWDQRRAMILEEILNRGAHLIGLQEVDDFSFLSAHLLSLGYANLFAAKPSSPCLTNKVNIGPDGCALFYHESRFKKIDSGSKVLSLDDGSPSNSVAAWTNLKELSKGMTLTMITTHLKAGDNEESASIRRQQTRDLVKLIRELLSKTSALVCCGDFNGDPHEEFYKVMTHGTGLESAYFSVLGSREPAWTTWKVRPGSTGEKKRCIDYIFYTKEALRPISVLALPEDDEMPAKRLPSLNFPSDHMDIAAKFKFC